MTAQRDVVGGRGVLDGVLDGVEVGEDLGVLPGVDDGGVIDGLGAGPVGMMIHGAPETAENGLGHGQMPYTPVLTRILLSPSRVGTSPWCPAQGPVRPLWPLQTIRTVPFTVRNPLYRLVANGTIPLDRAPVIDARSLTVTMATAKDRWWYSHLRGLYMRWLPHGVRIPAMVRWGGPHRRDGKWIDRWSPRTMGAVWLWPDLQPHSRWGLSLEHYLDSYQSWFAPVLGFDSGIVLDTRMLALMGHVIPLPDAVADLLRPMVRCLSLADIPTPAMVRAFGWPRASRNWLGDAPWVPGSTPRYSRARWERFIEQFPHVPVLVPACKHPRDLPHWLRAPTMAEPLFHPAGTCYPPPASGTVSLRWPKPVSRAMVKALFDRRGRQYMARDKARYYREQRAARAAERARLAGHGPDTPDTAPDA